MTALTVRRVLFFGAVCATTLLGTTEMFDIVRTAGVTPLEIIILALFAPTFAWISLTFWNAVVGFTLRLLRRDPLTLGRAPTRAPAPTAPVTTRTALVMPAHNEDPERVTAGLEAMMRSLEGTGLAGHFDVHLLSDTTDPEIARAEASAWEALRVRAPRPGRMHYRRRPTNSGGKAGNIAEFCDAHGSQYDLMVVLDADSVMSGPTLVRLVREMQANPSAGLIQTVPIPAGQRTLFGRFVQFASAVYGPMLATGQAFWQGESANYFGHNAIVRVRPFMAHARLPVLPGRPPLGGRILSHDFVEAALLRRAGWLVYSLPDLAGSWEGVPPNVPDFAKRDRRWAQGSLQHLRLVRTRGLHPLSRLHFVLGAMGYVASVLWLMLLAASTAYVVFPSLSADPFLGGWPDRIDGVIAVVPLLALTAVVLFLPKVLGLTLALLRRRSEHGGAIRLTTSALLETAFSVLVAPVMMMYHTRFVLEVLAGRDVAWGAQSRADRNIAWGEAWHGTLGITAVGVAWCAWTAYVSPIFALWLSPIFVGLLLAAPIVRWSGGTGVGQFLRRRGILLVTSETGTPPELGRPETGSGPWSSTSLDGSRVERVTDRMHEAERGLFDLRRGHAVCVVPAAGSNDRPILATPVETLDPGSLEELKRLGSGPIRLVVTGRRAERMGVEAESGTEPHAFTLGLNGETPEALYRLSSALDADPARLDPRPATEVESAALDLVRFGRLLPAVVVVPADPERVPELTHVLESGRMLRVGTSEIRQMARARSTDVVVTHVSEATVPLEEAENARFMLFREANGLLEHVAIIIGDQLPDPVPVRLHSACLTGDLFGSLRCDCGEQLRGSLRSFVKSGGGILLYLQQEGRGIGLGNKLRAYALQQAGLDTIDADHALGFGPDERRYDAAVGMLRHLGVERVRLLTNNPEKVQALQEGGIEVSSREPLHGTLNRHNLPYVRAKVQRAGHWLGDMLGGAGPGR